MGHRHDVAAVAAAHVMQPAFPARRDHLCRLSAARPVSPNVPGPGIDLEPLDGIPSNALPATETHLDQILRRRRLARRGDVPGKPHASRGRAAVYAGAREDRKSTRLNSSHVEISYAVFCLNKK